MTATALPTLKARSVQWVLWLPAVVIAVGYIIAKISSFSWLLLIGLGLTPLARRTFLASPKLWEVASALYLLFFWADVFLVSRHMGIALTHLLTFLIIARSWTPDTPRTVGQRLGLVFALWVVIGAANNDAYYMSVSLAALVAFLWALMAFQVWRDGTPEEPVYRLGPLAVGMTLGVAVLGALIFLVLPRSHFGFLYTDRMTLQGEGWTGLSDRIDLGSITRLKQDARVAFRVYLRPGSLPPEALYWRGLTLDIFDGRQWRSSDPGHPRPILRTSIGLWGLEVPRPSLALKGQVIDQEIWPAGEEPALLHLSQPLIVAVPGRLALRVAPGLTFPATRVRSYTVRSLWVRPPRGRYAVGPDPWASIGEGRGKSWLSLPAFVSPAVRRLAVEWTAGATSAVEKAHAIERAFHRYFRYTTVNLAGRSADPIGTFLTRTRAGYCEYFASAMVLMLRTLGVPARVVIGYHGGQWNDQGGFWEVLHQDAHAWVEAWDDQAGLWVAFDPTPPVVAPVRSGVTGWLRRLREWQSAIAFWWDRQVILYSAREQWELGQGLFESLERWLRQLQSSIPSWRPEAGRLFRRETAWAVGLALVGLVSLLWLWQKRAVWIGRLRGRTVSPWQDYYVLLRWVERWAGTRRPSETPMAYIRRAQARRPEVAADLQEATRVFYDLRFHRASPEAVRQLQALVRTCIRRAPSKNRC